MLSSQRVQGKLYQQLLKKMQQNIETILTTKQSNSFLKPNNEQQMKSGKQKSLKQSLRTDDSSLERSFQQNLTKRQEEQEVNQVDEYEQVDLSIFRKKSAQIQNVIRDHPYQVRFDCEKYEEVYGRVVQTIMSGSRKIKSKMMIKLMGWMHKFCIQTLRFSIETFQLAMRILLVQIDSCDESPKKLQMLGCVCLHIASKINERSIVSIQSYIECCMSIFNRDEFEQREAQIFTLIQNHQQIIEPAVFKIFTFLCEQLQQKQEQQQIKIGCQRLETLLRELQFYSAQPLDIATYIWVQQTLHYKYKNMEQILQQIREAN